MAPGFVGCDFDCDATVATWNVWTGADSGTTTSSTNANIWVPWCKVYDQSTYSTSSATTQGYVAEAWYGWNCSRLPVQTASFDGTWHRWTLQVGKPLNGVVTATPQDLAIWERQAEEARQRDEVRRREWEAGAEERRQKQLDADLARNKAAQRAQRLLLELLDEEQTKEYREKKQFHVVAANGERYLVDATGRHGNIKRLNAQGHAVEKLCAPLGDSECPTLDHIVAQLLALRHNIDHLLQRANRTQLLADNAERILPRRA